MATLVARPLLARDLPALRHARQRVAILDWDTRRECDGPRVAQHAFAAIAPGYTRERVYVALIDGELCAALSMRSQEITHHWDVAILAAGSPRLDAEDTVVLELWTALLEYGIAASGALGGRRIFAAAEADSIAYQSLRAVGFEPYTRQTMLRAVDIGDHAAPPVGMRSQEPSDVWSIQHLYHHVTPRPVQFAEALTSAAWEIHPQTILGWLLQDRQRQYQSVLETVDGIVAYSRITRRHRCARIELPVDPCALDAAPAFVAATVAESGAHGCSIEIIIPEYRADLAWKVEGIGFDAVADRIALVRHTTAPATVRERFAAPAEGERAPKGVPSYFCSRGGSTCGAVVSARDAQRMER